MILTVNLIDQIDKDNLDIIRQYCQNNHCSAKIEVDPRQEYPYSILLYKDGMLHKFSASETLHRAVDRLVFKIRPFVEKGEYTLFEPDRSLMTR